METQRLTLALLLWLVCGFGIVLLRRRSPLHPMLLALLTTGLIGSFYPVLSIWIETRSWRHAVYAEDQLIVRVQLEFLVYAIALLTGFAVFRGRAGRSAETYELRTVPNPDYLRHRERLVPFGLVSAGLALYGLYVLQVGLGSLMDRDNFALKYQMSDGLGPLVLGLHLAIVGCFWAEASEQLGPRAKRCYRFVAFLIVIWSVAVIAQRTNAVIVALGYAAIYCRRNGLQLRRVRPALVVGILVLYGSVEAFSIVRATWKDGLGQSLDALAAVTDAQESALGTLIGGSELSHPVFTSIELMQMEEPGALGGSSYLAAPATLIPKTLAPQRPNTLALDFVAENYPAMAARGGGAAFSHLAEAWWNFGALLGSALLGTLAGLLHALWDRANARRPWSLLAMLTPYYTSHVVILHRYEVATFLKQTLSVTLPALCVLVAAHLIWTGTGRTTRPQTARGPRAQGEPS
jgi:O-antigen polysaccharide polymerase Wzy-like protein